MQITYGITVQDKDDPFISVAETALQTLIAGNAGSYLGEFSQIRIGALQADTEPLSESRCLPHL